MNGSEKRHGLEEVKVDLREAAAVPSSIGQATPINPPTLPRPSYQRSVSTDATSADNRLLQAPDVSSVRDRQLIFAFRNEYVPVGYIGQGGSPCLWLEQIIA